MVDQPPWPVQSSTGARPWAVPVAEGAFQWHGEVEGRMAKLTGGGVGESGRQRGWVVAVPGAWCTYARSSKEGKWSGERLR
jgi:hypothetical protein